MLFALVHDAGNAAYALTRWSTLDLPRPNVIRGAEDDVNKPPVVFSVPVLLVACDRRAGLLVSPVLEQAGA